MEPRAHIRTYSKPTCLLCGGAGDIVYGDLEDLLFCVPGNWDLKKCRVPECGLLWLDPCPIPEDTNKLYEKYYTHAGIDSDPLLNTGDLKNGIIKPWLYSFVKRILLIRRDRRRLNDMYLTNIEPGRLLELGCGDGRRLLRLQKKGWSVEGQEVDRKAIAHVRSRIEAPIYEGDLNDLSLSHDSYDAILMNHVIEHLIDPIGVLRECFRILKPGGRVVVTTPNTESYGHLQYGSCWRGLEPPRHLYLFNRKNLLNMAEMAGFKSRDSWTTASKAETFSAASISIQTNSSYPRRELHVTDVKLGSMTFQVKATLLKIFRPDSGEECVLVGYK